MWPATEFTRRLGIRYPIIQAPMAGGPTSAALVAAVSNSGGLGSLGAAGLSPAQIRSEIRAIKALTDKPFLVNLLLHAEVKPAPGELARAGAVLDPYRRELGIPAGALPNRFAESVDEQFAAVLAEGVPAFSFHFDVLPRDKIAAMRRAGATLLGTATTVGEACRLDEEGIDVIVAQGYEAGGHRGTFAAPVEESLIGTMALVPQIVDAVKAPVVAAGGIMDGRGIAAAMALGAAAVQMGTAFLACDESGAHPLHKRGLTAGDGEATALTRIFSGRHARALRNRFMAEMEKQADAVAAYPIQNALTAPIRAAAAKQGKPEFMSMWAGQGHRMARTMPAAALIAALVAETEAVLRRTAASGDQS